MSSTTTTTEPVIAMTEALPDDSFTEIVWPVVNGVYIPSPEAIAAECLLIQSSWTKGEFRKRRRLMTTETRKAMKRS
jgi:hypothetical protein